MLASKRCALFELTSSRTSTLHHFGLSFIFLILLDVVRATDPQTSADGCCSW